MKQLYFALFITLFNLPLTAQITREIRIEGSNLTGFTIQETNDGGFLLSAHRWPYTPNSIFIEGASTSLYIQKINYLTQSSYSASTPYEAPVRFPYILKPFEDNVEFGEVFHFLMNTTDNYGCDFTTTFGGLNRLAGYVLGSEGGSRGNPKGTSFNEECEYRLIDYVYENGTQLFENYYALAHYRNIRQQVEYTNLVRAQPSNTYNISWEIPLPDNREYSAIINTLDNDTYIIQRNRASNEISLRNIDASTAQFIAAEIVIIQEPKLNSIDRAILINDTEFLLTMFREEEDGFIYDILKVGLDGDVKWRREYPVIGWADRTERDLFINSNGTILFVSPSLNPNTNFKNILLQIWNEDGEVIGEKMYDFGENGETPNSVFQDREGNVVMLSTVNCCNQDSIVDGAYLRIIKDDISDLISTNVKSHLPSKSFDFFPNPVKDYLNFTSESTLIAKVEVFNLLGIRILASEKPTSKKIDVGKLDSGLYFLKVQDLNGEIYTKQFIKID